MNATTNNAATVPAIEVLCRFDPAKNKPVVFIASNMQGSDIQSWISGDAVMSPLSYYHSTLPLSTADEEVLAKRYARHFHAAHVLIRHRLPRTARVVPNRIATSRPAAQVATDSVITALTPTPTPAPVVELAPAVEKAKRKPAAKKVVAKKGRKPAAKPIENRADTMRRAADKAPAPTEAAPVALEQKVEQLTAMMATILEKLSVGQAPQ